MQGDGRGLIAYSMLVPGLARAMNWRVMLSQNNGAEKDNGNDLSKTCEVNVPEIVANDHTSTTHMPLPAARRHEKRTRGLITVGAVVVVIAISVIGLLTSWFGLVKPHVTSGVYVFTDNSTSHVLNVTIAKDDYLAYWANIGASGRFSDFPGSGYQLRNLQIKQVNSDQIYGGVDFICFYDGSDPYVNLDFVVPRDVSDEITGTWAFWLTDESGSKYGYLTWARFESNGTFRYENFTSSSSARSAATLIMSGDFQGDSGAQTGSWSKQGDGNFLLTLANGDTYTLQRHR